MLAKPNRFCKKDNDLCLMGLEGYYELLKRSETNSTEGYRQQMINLNHALIENRLIYALYIKKIVQNTLESLNSPLFYCQLFLLMGYKF